MKMSTIKNSVLMGVAVFLSTIEYTAASIRYHLGFGGQVKAGGVFTEYVNGVAVGEHKNLVPTEGLNAIAIVMLGAQAKYAAWYVMLFSNETTPLATWTAANFNANAAEITSESEGYEGVNRPQWVPNAAVGGVIDNYGGEASFTVVCTTTLSVAGAAITSAQARGATTGKLLAASRFSSTRVLNNGDTYKIGYRFTFSSV